MTRWHCHDAYLEDRRGTVMAWRGGHLLGVSREMQSHPGMWLVWPTAGRCSALRSRHEAIGWLLGCREGCPAGTHEETAAAQDSRSEGS